MKRWITIEGGEGVGKSTFIALLKQRLEQSGAAVVTTREPGGSPIAEAIRDLFHHPRGETWDPLAELFALSAARMQHLKTTIEPALLSGAWVLCDRFIDSTRVYQGVLGKVSMPTVETVLQWSVKPEHIPHKTFLLDMDVRQALQRITDRHDATRFDRMSVERHELIREGFLSLARQFPSRVVVLDAAAAQEVLVKQAMQHLREAG